MKTTLLLATGVTALFAATAAFASTPGVYFSGDGGLSILPSPHFNSDLDGTSNAKYNPGYTFGGAVGYDLGNGMRIEVNSQHSNQQLISVDEFKAYGHLSSTTLMANGQIDLIKDAPFTPYVGVGLGAVNYGGHVDNYSGRAWRPGYQLEAGLRKDISNQISVFGGYRFTQALSVDMRDPLLADNATQHFSNHAVTAGLTYHLGQN